MRRSQSNPFMHLPPCDWQSSSTPVRHVTPQRDHNLSQSPMSALLYHNLIRQDQHSEFRKKIDTIRTDLHYLKQNLSKYNDNASEAPRPRYENLPLQQKAYTPRQAPRVTPAMSQHRMTPSAEHGAHVVPCCEQQIKSLESRVRRYKRENRDLQK